MLSWGSSDSEIAGKLCSKHVYGVSHWLVLAVLFAVEGMTPKQRDEWVSEVNRLSDGPSLGPFLRLEYDKPQSYPPTIWVSKRFTEGLFGLVPEDNSRNAPTPDAHINASLESLREFWLGWSEWCITRCLCARNRPAIVPPDPKAWALRVLELSLVRIEEICGIYTRPREAQNWVGSFCSTVQALSERLADEKALASPQTPAVSDQKLDADPGAPPPNAGALNATTESSTASAERREISAKKQEPADGTPTEKVTTVQGENTDFELGKQIDDWLNQLDELASKASFVKDMKGLREKYNKNILEFPLETLSPPKDDPQGVLHWIANADRDSHYELIRAVLLDHPSERKMEQARALYRRLGSKLP